MGVVGVELAWVGWGGEACRMRVMMRMRHWMVVGGLSPSCICLSPATCSVMVFSLLDEGFRDVVSTF